MEKGFLLKNSNIFFVIYLFLFSISLFASDNFRIDINEVKEKHTFYGLAAYYNNINYYIVDKQFITKVENNTSITLKKNQWLSISGRFNVLNIKKEGLSINIQNDILYIDKNPQDIAINLVPKNKLHTISPELDQIRYYHLWEPLAWLSKTAEFVLVFIQNYIVSSWGWTIVVFAIFLKFLLLPVGIMTTKFQRKVSQVQSALAPKLKDIKANYDGEEAHNRIMSAHKDLGVSPFYTLKPMLGSFIQVPILIATFNALGEMPQFAGESFLWIHDLSYPDAIMSLNFTIPMFGNTINLLPFLMTIITIYSTIVFQNKHAPVAEVKRQKRNLYFMAFAFFVLFYPFPAAMVLYWTLANILQFIQQKYVEI